MLKKSLILFLVIILSMTAVSISNAVAQGPSDYDSNFPIIIPFWQRGDSYADFFVGNNLHGWGCDKYADHGIASPCYKPDGIHFADDTIGAKGCAITSLTMLFWNHGINSVPDSGAILDPGKLDDWLVDNHGYNSSRDLIWWVAPEKFSRPIEWLGISYNGGDLGFSFFTTTGHQFMVPNYCCNDSCSQKAFNCFRVFATSTKFEELLYKCARQEFMILKSEKIG